LQAVGFCSPLQRLGQGVFAYRLHQVSGSVYLKRLQRIMIISGAENDRGRALKLAQVGGNVHAVGAGHANVQQYNVQQYNVRLQFGNGVQCTVAVGRFTANAVSGKSWG